MGRALEAKGYTVTYWGEGKKIEENLCEQQSIVMQRPKDGSRWKRWKQLLSSMKQHAKDQPPLACLLFGGFSSFALGSWALLHRCPYHLFEQNAIPGRVNRLLSFKAQTAFLTFPLQKYRFFCKNQHLSGNPVRSAPSKSEARSHDLLILGGSQGAKALNQTLPQQLSRDLKVIHLCGPNRKSEAETAWQGNKNVDIVESSPDVPALLGQCRWVITRAGATSLSEIAAIGIATIAVPYPHAKDDHQRANAEHLEKKQALLILDENSIDTKRQWLHDTLNDTSLQLQLENSSLHSGLADIEAQRALELLKL